MKNKIREAAEAIWRDLSCRNGIGDTWYNIEESVREEIITRIMGIIEGQVFCQCEKPNINTYSIVCCLNCKRPINMKENGGTK